MVRGSHRCASDAESVSISWCQDKNEWHLILEDYKTLLCSLIERNRIYVFCLQLFFDLVYRICSRFNFALFDFEILIILCRLWHIFALVIQVCFTILAVTVSTPVTNHCYDPSELCQYVTRLSIAKIQAPGNDNVIAFLESKFQAIDVSGPRIDIKYKMIIYVPESNKLGRVIAATVSCVIQLLIQINNEKKQLLIHDLTSAEVRPCTGIYIPPLYVNVITYP